MKANQVYFAVRTMAQVLNVSASGYYDWLDRPISSRAQANVQLLESIRQVHAMSDATYGVPRVKAQLAHQGCNASFNRIARQMQKANLRGVSRRRGFVVTTNANHLVKPAVDLVKRIFKASEPNSLWVADLTYYHRGSLRCRTPPAISEGSPTVVRSATDTLHLVHGAASHGWF
jgi:putative transposase